MKTLLLILLPFVASCQIMPGIIGSSKKQNPQEPPAVVFAGPDQTIQDDETVQLDGVGPDGSIWTTDGDGSFSDDEILNAVYTPGATDISSGTITWEGINIFDNPGYTGNVVFLLQDPTANYHFKDTIYVPLSATSHYADQRISPTGTITDEAVWIETNSPPRPTLGLPPEEEYQAYQKVVTDPYFYSRGFGFRTPDPE